MDELIKKELVFKQYVEGIAKKSNRPFRMVELHDDKTLENTKFFLPDGSGVSTTGLQFKDRVIAKFSAQMMFGRLEFVLDSLEKLPAAVRA